MWCGFNRNNGEGFVAAHSGDYADALSKRRSIVLFNVETTGAIGWRGVRLVRALSKLTGRKGENDRTIYGESRASTRSFFVHHTAAIAGAVVSADALVLENAAADHAHVTTLARAASHHCA